MEIDLDISLYPHYKVNKAGTKRYDIEIRFTRAGSLNKAKGHVDFDFETLQSFYNKGDYQTYGQHLSQCLFADPDVLAIFTKAHQLTDDHGNRIPLRVRLFILPRLMELHHLHWETIIDPDPDGESPVFLLKNDKVCFFRYLTNAEWKPVPLLPQEKTLRALIFVSNPQNGGDYGFEPIDVDAALSPIENGLGNINKVRYPVDPGDRATLDALITTLNAGFNILYLICPATAQKNKTYLFFEDNQGMADKVRGKTLITRLKELTKKPFLIIICSCHTHKKNKLCHMSEIHCGLSQRMVSSGFPVVLSIQGKMSDASKKSFLESFFLQLAEYDQIDKAVAVARRHTKSRYEGLMPVLYMRMKSGRIWYKKGFSSDTETTWKDLIHLIVTQKKCVPILGPGLSENILGSHREIAQDWANTYNFPLTLYHQDQLHLVAHYMSVVHRDPRDIKTIDFLDYFFSKLKNRFKDKLTDPQTLNALEKEYKADPGKTINRFVCEDISADMRENLREPHMILARLPSQIYITTQVTDLMKEALSKLGREPFSRHNIWRSKTKDTGYDSAKTRKDPLIFHLFGHITEPENLILSEDEHFDLMIDSARDINNMDDTVAGAVMNNCILLLGFHLYDWSFKVLIRTLLNRDKYVTRRNFPIIAVQIDPEDGLIMEAYGARKYLEEYFKKILGANRIMIYWGKPEDFLEELYDKL